MRKWSSLEEWIKIWGVTKEDKAISSIHENLKRRYEESHRHYHNLDHIEACLSEFKEVENLLQHPFEVWLGIWFHDIVYDPKGTDNENKSAEYTVNALKGSLKEDSLELVSSFVIATKHDKPASSEDEGYVMDIDLAILGQDKDTFDEYERNIRLEYGWVSNERFNTGRANLLRGFLERESIYQTEYFREKYEDTSRRNLANSIVLLESVLE